MKNLMKQMTRCAAVGLWLTTLNLLPPACFAQGQIDQRKPISSAPFTIRAPGSYYLTTNLTIRAGTAISVNTNNVTLDLNGFTITSTETPAASSVGILLNAAVNVTILHGFISGGVTNNGGTYGGSGFGCGIYSGNVSSPANVRVSGVSVSGCLNEGILLSEQNNSVVESCTVNTVGYYGISATSVSDSTVQNCGYIGVAAITANNCQGYGLSAYGVVARTANNCYGYSSSGHGIDADTANNCSGYSSIGNGVIATTASNCFGDNGNGGGSGVSATTAINCVGYNENSNVSGGCGIYARIATSCYGFSYNATAINATLAIGCIGFSPAGTPLNVVQNVNSIVSGY